MTRTYPPYTTLCTCPECGTIYTLAHGNQRYCSTKCRLVYTHRRYRETHRTVLAARARIAYRTRHGLPLRREDRV